ncbi:hypothetical protein GV827_22555, partial [Sulfitobacter sp. JBTF-M27]|nr:hypothetical protein [Sulfitobacter sediminilitoris]
RKRTRVFSELVSHYLFEDRFGRPGKGNDKGKVEGTVGYTRRNFMVPMAHALAYPNALQALHFLIQWPAPDHAAQLVENRTDELDGNCYEVLAPAAEILAEKHPLAATLALRAMIEFTLGAARSKRYRHAARHLLECDNLARQANDFGAIEAHDAFVARLKTKHGRKQSFWQLVH